MVWLAYNGPDQPINVQDDPPDTPIDGKWITFAAMTALQDRAEAAERRAEQAEAQLVEAWEAAERIRHEATATRVGWIKAEAEAATLRQTDRRALGLMARLWATWWGLGNAARNASRSTSITRRPTIRVGLFGLSANAFPKRHHR
jgi:hypothetical protein